MTAQLRYDSLGRTGLLVSRISLGTAAFGVAPVADDAIALMHRALELGVNFIDMANAYGLSPSYRSSRHAESGGTPRLRGDCWRGDQGTPPRGHYCYKGSKPGWTGT